MQVKNDNEIPSISKHVTSDSGKTVLKLRQLRTLGQKKQFWGAKKYGHELLDESRETLSSLVLHNSLYIVAIIGIGILWSTPTTLVPLTNVIEHPGYFGEEMATCSFLTYAAYQAAITMVEVQLTFHLKWKNLRWLFAGLFATLMVSLNTTWGMCYLIWTVWLKYNSPIPFAGVIVWLANNLVLSLAISVLFPVEMRINKKDRKRIQAYVYYRLWYIGYTIQQHGMEAILGALSGKFQWLLSIILPIVREVNLSMLIYILKKAVDFEATLPLIPKLTVILSMNVIFAFHVAVRLGHAASKTTGYALVAVDLLLNFYSTYKITKSCRKVVPNDHEKARRHKLETKEEVLKLIGTELVEFLVPMIYLITFTISFYGPNAEIIGGVKFSGWHYEKVEDLVSFSAGLLVMFSVDLACLIISATLLWKFSSTNILNEGLKLVKVYWKYLAIQIGGTIFAVS